MKPLADNTRLWKVWKTLRKHVQNTYDEVGSHLSIDFDPKIAFFLNIPKTPLWITFPHSPQNTPYLTGLDTLR